VASDTCSVEERGGERGAWTRVGGGGAEENPTACPPMYGRAGGAVGRGGGILLRLSPLPMSEWVGECSCARNGRPTKDIGDLLDGHLFARELVHRAAHHPVGALADYLQDAVPARVRVVCGCTHDGVCSFLARMRGHALYPGLQGAAPSLACVGVGSCPEVVGGRTCTLLAPTDHGRAAARRQPPNGVPASGALPCSLRQSRRSTLVLPPPYARQPPLLLLHGFVLLPLLPATPPSTHLLLSPLRSSLKNSATSKCGGLLL